jgi:hypothetical protein
LLQQAKKKTEYDYQIDKNSGHKLNKCLQNNKTFSCDLSSEIFCVDTQR